MNNEFYDTVILSQIAKQNGFINPDDVIFNIDDFSKTSDDDR